MLCKACYSSGVGWGGIITVRHWPCVLMHFHTYVMLRCCAFSCTFTHTSCYSKEDPCDPPTLTLNHSQSHSITLNHSKSLQNPCETALVQGKKKHDPAVINLRCGSLGLATAGGAVGQRPSWIFEVIH